MSIAEIAYRLNLAESTVREWLWHADVAPARLLPASGRRKVPVRSTTGFVPEIAEPEVRDEGTAVRLPKSPAAAGAAAAEAGAGEANAAQATKSQGAGPR